MYRVLIVPAVLFSLIAAPTHLLAQSNTSGTLACALADGMVVCGPDIKDGATILAAMANPATGKVFKDALNKAGVFADGYARRIFAAR